MSDCLIIARRQFDPSMEMLKEVIECCPDDLWYKINGGFPFWQQVFHTLFSIDYWFNFSIEEFCPPDFNKNVTGDLDEESEEDLSKEEIKKYFDSVSKKCDAFFSRLTDRLLFSKSGMNDRMTYLDIILMEIRHTQYHVGHCNCIFRQNKVKPAVWL